MSVFVRSFCCRRRRLRRVMGSRLEKQQIDRAPSSSYRKLSSFCIAFRSAPKSSKHFASPTSLDSYTMLTVYYFLVIAAGEVRLFTLYICSLYTISIKPSKMYTINHLKCIGYIADLRHVFCVCHSIPVVVYVKILILYMMLVSWYNIETLYSIYTLEQRHVAGQVYLGIYNA